MKYLFRADIFDSVRPGHVFVLSGRTKASADQFKVYFKNEMYKPTAEDTIPLHLAIYFPNNRYIVRDSKIAGSDWVHQENEENCLSSIRNPIVAGELFKIFILVSDEHFHIAINDKLYCTFKFRTNLNSMRALEVNSDTDDLQSIVQFDQRSIYPTLHPPIQIQENCTSLDFSCDIPSKLTRGYVTVITAIPYGNPCGSFMIYITEGATQKQALQFKAVFHPYFVVVRSAMNDKLCFPCEHNETSGSFPFTINKKFKLAICYTDNEFKFAVRGAIFSSFKYRSPNLPDNLNGLKVSRGCDLYMQVYGVQHINLGSTNGDGFENYSRFSIFD